MTDAAEITESTGHANTIFSALTAGVDLTLPDIDLNASIYDPPTVLGNPLYTPPTALTIDDLTTGTVDGTGVFDVLMQTLNAQFEVQFKKGRITGADYAQAYVGATTGALGTAVQFLLGRDQAYMQALLAQMQARVAEANVAMAALQVEQTRADVINARANALTAQTQYALTKMKLTTEAVSIEQLEASVAKIEYETINLLPKEGVRLDKQIEIATSEISKSVAQVDQLLYQTANILPSQNAGLTKDNAIKDYQLSDVLTSQVAGVLEDTQGKVYNRSFILPATLDNINEQIEGNRAKTLDTRRDATTVTGSVGVQKDLQKEQITSYKRDAETKMTKMVIDTWMLQKSTDEGLAPPTALSDAEINSLMGSLKTNLGL